MRPADYSLEDHALEIIILALGFLILIVAFIAVILTTARLRRASDAELGRRSRARTRRWDSRTEAPSFQPYQDKPKRQSLRRCSISFVGDVTTQLVRLTGMITPPKLSGKTTPVEGFLFGTLRRFSLQSISSRRASQQEASSEELEHDPLDTSVSVSGWDHCIREPRRRSARSPENAQRAVKEAQVGGPL